MPGWDRMGVVDGDKIQVSVQAAPDDVESWTGLARRCEQVGCRALLVSDHPGTGPSPFVALAAAAGVTADLRLGSYVVNAGIRDPLLIASDVATLDVVSDGRAELGIGAGHTPAEWEMTGSSRPAPSERVQRLITMAGSIRQLLHGEAVAAADLGVLRDVRLAGPRPVQQSVPLLVGGGNRQLLRWAGAHADTVGLSGLGRTLADGHGHTVRWSPGQVDDQVGLVHQGAQDAGVRVPELEALVQQVTITDDGEEAAAALAERVNTPAEDLLAAPYAWIGTVPEIADQIHAAYQTWGISRWVVRSSALDDAANIIAAV